MQKTKNFVKLETIVMTQVNIEVVHLVYVIIIKELAEELEKQFTYLGENTEKYETCSVAKEKVVVTSVDKNGEGITKTISYRL